MNFMKFCPSFFEFYVCVSLEVKRRPYAYKDHIEKIVSFWRL